MRIISKYKDYYDYLSGVYGVDEKLVLDRREMYTPYISSMPTVDTYYIGEWMVQGFSVSGELLYGNEVSKYANQKRYIHYDAEKDYTKAEYWIIPNGGYSNLYCLKEPKFLGDKCPTWKEDCPIIEYIRKDTYKKFPLLRAVNMQKVFKPEQVWLMLSEWLGKRITKNEPIVPVGDDKVRIQAAGFDLKTSFRNVK